MNTTEQSMEALQDIKRMMERSSRFISLSGWSGVSAGLAALIGAWLAKREIDAFHISTDGRRNDSDLVKSSVDMLSVQLIRIAVVVFIAALVSAFLFTYIRSRKTGVAVWGPTAQRLMWNTILPLMVGGFVILRLLQVGHYGLVAPCCLIFYGLALINGSKYTLGEVRWLGYAQVILGIINLWMPGYGLIFWAIGFGLLHIIYGITMWMKYERREIADMR
jgi:hypothetical protein